MLAQTDKKGKKDEDRVIKQFAYIYKECKDEEKKEQLRRIILEELGRAIELIELTTQHSIGFYFMCKSLAALQHLMDAYTSGDMKQIIKKICSSLLGFDQLAINEITWTKSNYVNGLQYFFSSMGLSIFSELYQLRSTQRAVCEVSDQFSSSGIDQLPVRLREIISTKAAGQLFIDTITLNPRAAAITMATLGAVSSLWSKTMTHRRCNKRRLLKRHFEKVCQQFICTTKQMPSLKVTCDSRVVGVAEMKDSMYVACSGSNKLLVYRCPYQIRICDITIDGLNDPSDIAVCSATSQLYVSDVNWQCAIWRVNLESNRQVDSFVSFQWQPWSMSVSCGRVLVIPIDGTSLYIYGDDGIELERIVLPDCMSAHHAVEITRSGQSKPNYIVAHSTRSTTAGSSSARHNVTEIDSRGQFIRALDDQRNDIDRALVNVPHYLMIDDDHHIIVSDLLNERIILTTDELQFERVIVKSARCQPMRMSFDRNTGELYVVDCYSGDISVYRVKRQTSHTSNGDTGVAKDQPEQVSVDSPVSAYGPSSNPVSRNVLNRLFMKRHLSTIRSTPESIARTITERRDDLIEMIDLDTGLVEELWRIGLLGYGWYIRLIVKREYEPNGLKHVVQILEEVCSLADERRVYEFLKALDRTNHKHVSNFIHCDGVFAPPNVMTPGL